MTGYEVIQKNLQRLNDIEADLKMLRDNIDEQSKIEINKSLKTVIDLFENLNSIDKSMEIEKMGGFEL